MAKTYTLHAETDDGTVQPAFATYANRRTAERVARHVARSYREQAFDHDVERVTVDLDGVAAASFDARRCLPYEHLLGRTIAANRSLPRVEAA